MRQAPIDVFDLQCIMIYNCIILKLHLQILNPEGVTLLLQNVHPKGYLNPEGVKLV